MNHLRNLILSVFVFFCFLQCSQLATLANSPASAIKPKPPVVTVSNVALVQYPNNNILARYYCPKVAPSLLCRVFGSVPGPAELRFIFDVTLNVVNPNEIPLPAVEAMVALTTYPGSQSQSNVGAVCVALCPEGERCGPPPQNGCQSNEPEIRSMNDFAAASVGFLTNVALGTVNPSDVKVRIIEPGQAIDITTRFEINPQAMLALLGNVAGDGIASIKKAKVPEFTVPYQIEGSVWVKLENFGRFAAGFGPTSGEWALK